MYGAVDFYQRLQGGGGQAHHRLRGLCGPQGRTRFDKVHELDAESRHLVLLCENEEGYRNLSYLVSHGLDGGLLYQAPDRPGPAAAALRGTDRPIGLPGRGDPQAAAERGSTRTPRRYALELSGASSARTASIWSSRTTASGTSASVNQGILRIHQETGIPLVCHQRRALSPEGGRGGPRYPAVHPDRQDGGRREPDALSSRGTSTSSSEEEMAALFPGYRGRAGEHRRRSPSMCNLDFEFGKYHLPEFQLPEGYDSFAYLKKLCDEGYRGALSGRDDRVPGPAASTSMDMIEKMGFIDYFLIVSDFIALRQKRRHPRGAGPGQRRGQSMVSLLPAHHRHRPHEVQPVLRAVPEPGAGQHAGYRHGLRRHAAGAR